MHSVRRVSVLGCPLDAVSFDQTVDLVRGCVKAGGAMRIATPNVDFVMQARRNAAFHERLWEADLLVADGVPVLWAARLLGVPLPGRVNGTQLAWQFGRLSAELGVPLALIGGGEGVAERAAEKLRKLFPGSRPHAVPTPTPLDESASLVIVERVRECGARLALVALGSPKQELWLARHLPEMGPVVGIGIGGAFDFISGDRQRAPAWMQRRGLEWLHRLAGEPRRLGRRYLIDDSPFVWLVIREAVRRHGVNFRSGARTGS